MNNDLKRVKARIGATVLGFCREVLQRTPSTFYMEDLTSHVRGQRWQVDDTVAPDSPGRILRLLRREGKLDYVVASRSESLYHVRRVND